jgi:hypothetical protein
MAFSECIERSEMKQVVHIGPEHIGKYTKVWTIDRSLPVRIVSVGEGLCGWMVLDPKMNLRSGKNRYNVNDLFTVYDTIEEMEKEI